MGTFSHHQSKSPRLAADAVIDMHNAKLSHLWGVHTSTPVVELMVGSTRIDWDGVQWHSCGCGKPTLSAGVSLS